MVQSTLSNRMRLLQWAMPLAVALLAAVFQLGPVRLIHDQFGHSIHWTIEVIFYSTAGPTVVWFGLRLIRHWLAEKEEAEAEVYRLNRELRQRVEDRTQELREKNAALASANTELQQLDLLKSEFVSLVSHELRAPLTNMRSALELIELPENAVDPNVFSTLEIVRDQVFRLTRLVEEVLNVSRIEAGGLHAESAEVDILEVMDYVVDEFAARQTGHRLTRPKGDVHPRVWADRDYLHEVIANLIDNAIKYSPINSEVRLAIEISAEKVIASVKDNGPGIDTQEQQHIFEKFRRLEMGDSKETYGYGLGLYICRRLVEAMNGKIWVESQRGEGATFRVALPLVP